VVPLLSLSQKTPQNHKKINKMSKLLTVEFDPNAAAVELHLNDLGIDFLIRTLQNLQAGLSNEHTHLMTEDWGGGELSSQRQNTAADVQLINHLKIMYWKD
jgi:hypothetical protein